MPALTSALTRAGRLGLAAALLTAVGLVGPTVAPAAAAAGDCPPVEIYFNSANPQGLYRYSPQYGSVSSLPLDQVVLDITFSPDGTTLYGLSGAGLSVSDQQTGETIEVIPIAEFPGGNALAQLPGGGLIAANGAEIYTIDLDTRTATKDPRTLPAGYSSSGDLLVLPNSDLLVVANQSEFPGGDALVRIPPEGVRTVLGVVPYSYGISASGDSIYLTQTNGGIFRLDGDLPTTAGGDLLPGTLVRESTGTLPYGATSINESKPCNAAFSAAVVDDSVPYDTPATLIGYAYPAGTTGTVTSRRATPCSARRRSHRQPTRSTPAATPTPKSRWPPVTTWSRPRSREQS